MSEASASPKSAYFWWVPQANRFAADDNSSFSQQIFDITVAEVESVVEPDGVANDIWRESVPLISIHTPILSISGT